MCRKLPKRRDIQKQRDQGPNQKHPWFGTVKAIFLGEDSATVNRHNEDFISRFYRYLSFLSLSKVSETIGKG